jgi:hypothetical protein
MTKKNQFSQKFIGLACQLEVQIEPLNVKAAWQVLYTVEVGPASFTLWLFQKLCGFPQHTAIFVDKNIGANGDWGVTLPALYCSDDSYVQFSERYSEIKLRLNGKSVKLEGWSFLDVFRDACAKFKEHIQKQYEAEYQALIAKNKTLRIPYPCIQVQVDVPNYDIYPKSKPYLVLFCNPDPNPTTTWMPITKANATKIIALGSIVTHEGK